MLALTLHFCPSALFWPKRATLTSARCGIRDPLLRAGFMESTTSCGISLIPHKLTLILHKHKQKQPRAAESVTPEDTHTPYTHMFTQTHLPCIFNEYLSVLVVYAECHAHISNNDCICMNMHMALAQKLIYSYWDDLHLFTHLQQGSPGLNIWQIYDTVGLVNIILCILL